MPSNVAELTAHGLNRYIDTGTEYRYIFWGFKAASMSRLGNVANTFVFGTLVRGCPRRPRPAKPVRHEAPSPGIFSGEPYGHRPRQQQHELTLLAHAGERCPSGGPACGQDPYQLLRPSPRATRTFCRAPSLALEDEHPFDPWLSAISFRYVFGESLEPPRGRIPT